MPYPVLLAVGAAMAAAGTGMQMAAQAESRNAMNSAQLAELQRQQGYQKSATRTALKSIEESSRPVADQQMGQGADAREKAYANVSQRTLGTANPSLPGSNVTVGPMERAQKQATATGNAWSKAVGQAQAKLGSYDDWGLQQNIKNQRANERLAVASNFARGSANVLPVEMEAASHKGDALAGWGQLVSALGSVAGGAGAVGYGPSIGAGAGAGSGIGVASNMATVPVGASPWSYAAWGMSK